MKKLIFVFCLAVPTIMAQDPTTGNVVPEFAAEWRVTGMIRRGSHAEASLERTGVRARFVREGDQLSGGVTVMQVDYNNRSVTLAKGNETAVIQPENIMAAPPPPPKAIGMSQQPKNKDGKTGLWPNPPQKPTAMRDGNGRWHIVLPNGHSEDMHAYAEKYGGVKGATDYLKDHLQTPHRPEREEYHKQQLEALKQMQAAGIR
ncbi:MAG: hypothetical protein NT105_01790 [Verrucomicrobia bacterium]|nr:hypothetical protein [Verrucomicrobiota bacterium]